MAMYMPSSSSCRPAATAVPATASPAPVDPVLVMESQESQDLVVLSSPEKEQQKTRAQEI